MKKYMALLLCAVLLLALCGCELGVNKMEQISGTWITYVDDSADEAESLLLNIELYDEELALCDLYALDYVKVLEFTADGDYRFGYDVDATMACVREYYDLCFHSLYDGRSTLSEVYGVDFEPMSWEEFSAYYAQSIYGFDDYAGFLDGITENSYDTELLAEDMENGTFRIKGKQILFTVTGESKEESVEYVLKDNNLHIEYSDGFEDYTRK